MFVSQADTLTTAGFEYQYNPRVVDADPGDIVSFSLTAAPAGMTIDASNGKVRWRPATTGTYSVAILASDTIGFATLQAYALVVGDPVVVPDVVGQPEATAAGTLTSANLVVGRKQTATHPTIAAGSVSSQTPIAGSVIEFGGGVDLILSLGPAPADIDNDNDGFTENQGDCDDNDDTIHPGAVDPEGDGIDQDCDGVDGNLELVEILVLPVDSTVLSGQSVSLKAIGIFVDGTSQNLTGIVSWSAGPVFSSPSPGVFNITATRAAIVGSAAVNVSARMPSDDVPPVAEITSPDNDATVTEPVNIIGTASDGNFLKYELAYAVAGDTQFTTIVTSTTPVSNDVLGLFDPTLLINDLYTIRLTVFDKGGNQTITEVVVQADENLKVGNFSLAFTDLQIPMSGIPITVTRTYDSRDKGEGDFGVGWRLNIQTLRIRSNRVLGSGWQVYKSGLVFALFPSDTHKVSLTLPDGGVEEFDLIISPETSPLIPFPPFANRASFKARPGTLGTLESLDNNNLSILDPQPGPVSLLDDIQNTTYNPDRFRYTMVNGTQIIISKSNGVESVREPNGNTLTFSKTGIVHSAGKSVEFIRDGQDRIVSVIDPEGNSRNYSYDSNGDLRAYDDAELNRVGFDYDRNHGLIRVIDSLGNSIQSNEFDGAGRLVATFDSDGNRTGFEHQVVLKTDIITDTTGAQLSLVYDANGNIIRSVDPLGAVTVMTYDANNNVTSETNQMGEVIVFSYDDKNRETSRTNALGHSSFYTYDNANRLTSIVDPNGGVTGYEYDARGNQVKAVDALGNVTQFTYAASGNLVSSTNARGFTSNFEYDASGNVVRVIVSG